MASKFCKSGEKTKSWQYHIENWSSGSLSKDQYCKEHKISLHQFYYWQKRFKKANEPTSKPAMAFAQVVPVKYSQIKDTFELHLPSGAYLKIAPHFDEAVLSRLLLTLRSSLC